MIGTTTNFTNTNTPTHYLTAYSYATAVNSVGMQKWALLQIDASNFKRPDVTYYPSGFTLYEHASAVGNFLNTGYDVIRLAFNKVNSSNPSSTDWAYVYLDPNTGNQITTGGNTVNFTSVAP